MANECNKNSCFQKNAYAQESATLMTRPFIFFMQMIISCFILLILELKHPEVSAQCLSVIAYFSVGMLCSRMTLIIQMNMHINDLPITACCFSTDRSDEQFSWDSRVPSALRTCVFLFVNNGSTLSFV